MLFCLFPAYSTDFQCAKNGAGSLSVHVYNQRRYRQRMKVTTSADKSLLLPSQPRCVYSAPGKVTLAAPAKINLNLLVGPRRADGFHEVDSYVAKVTLYDQIEIKLRHDGAIRFTCRGADCGSDDRNLAFLAARSLTEGRKVLGADITLTKRIPPGKGLGGGSSDAAAVLVALNELWRLNFLSTELTTLAAALGSDVPLFLGGPASRLTGRGELASPAIVHPLVAMIYLGSPACPTTDVYRAYDETPTVMADQLNPSLLPEMPSLWRDKLINQLIPAARRVSPALGESFDRLSKSLSIPLCMSGSGSALFALFDDAVEAASALSVLSVDLRADCVLVGLNPW